MGGGKGGGKSKKKKKGGGGAAVAASDGRDHLKVCGPASVQTLRGRLLGREVALICCGESHEDVIDLTREKGVLEAEEDWVKVPCEDGMGFDPEEVVATQDGLTLQSAKAWAERIVTRGGGGDSDDSSEEEDDGGFLVFEREGTGPKARGTARLFPEDAKRSREHRLADSAVVFEWADMDAVAREYNKRRLAGESVPFEELDAITAARKQLRRAEGFELFDDWLLRQVAVEGGPPVQLVLEASVPAEEVELHCEASAGAMPPSPACIRQLEPDSEADEEDAEDPASDGRGSFLSYLFRRTAGQLPPGSIRCFDPRDLGDPGDEAEEDSFQRFLAEPLPPDPDDAELDALGIKPPADSDEESGGEESRGRGGRVASSGPPVPSWEAYFSAAAELLYYSPQVKADFAPFLARCVRTPAALRRFFEALYFGTVPEALAAIQLGGEEQRALSRIRSPVCQPAGPRASLQRRGAEIHNVPVRAAPVDRYLKAKGFDEPRTWVSGLSERLRAKGAKEVVDAAKRWFWDAVEYLLSDPKEADEEGDYFAAWLRACHRDIYDDIDRSDPAELRGMKWAQSDSHPKSKKHRYKIGDITIPDIEQAFQELSRFDPAKRVSTPRERVLAKILLDCFQLRIVDLAAILQVADAAMAAEPGGRVVVLFYAGGDHANSVADFWRARGFGSAGLPQKGLVGKDDWEDDEPRVLTFPAYLHDFGTLFPVQ